MKQAAKDKASITRKMNQAAGAKPPLPGQHPHREQVLRAEYTAFLKPADFAEMIWVLDMACCQAAIEFFDAQIVGVRMRHMKQAHKNLTNRDFYAPQLLHGARKDPETLMVEVQLDIYAEQNFAPKWSETLLGNAAFGSLLGATNRQEIEEIRLLQAARHVRRTHQQAYQQRQGAVHTRTRQERRIRSRSHGRCDRRAFRLFAIWPCRRAANFERRTHQRCFCAHVRYASQRYRPNRTVG